MSHQPREQEKLSGGLDEEAEKCSEQKGQGMKGRRGLWRGHRGGRLSQHMRIWGQRKARGDVGRPPIDRQTSTSAQAPDTGELPGAGRFAELPFAAGGAQGLLLSYLL